MGKVGKGFKKPQQKKYFTKKDIIGTVVVAVVLAAIVVAVALIIRNDDFIRRNPDGTLQMEDTWIVADYSKTGTAQYYKVGEIGNVEGYALDDSSAQSATKYLVPVEEGTLPSVFVYAANADYQTAISSTQKGALPTGDPVSLTLAGRGAAYLVCDIGSLAAEEAELLTEEAAQPAEEAEQPAEEAETAEDAAPVEGTYVWAYIDYDDSHSICIYLTSDTKPEDTKIEETLVLVSNALTLEER